MLKQLIRPLVQSARNTRRQIRWLSHSHQVCTVARKSGQKLRVSYAHSGWPNPLPGATSIVSGGAVKYQYLAKSFPDSGLSFDILYVVSSSCTEHINSLIRTAQKHKAKIVWNQNGVYHPQTYADATFLNRQMADSYRLSDYVFYQSQFSKESAEVFLGERAGPGEILYNAIDTSFFSPSLERRQTVQELRLLMAGSHYSDYRLPVGVHTLAAVRRHRPARLVIAGRIMANLKQQVMELIESLRLTPYVDFLGPYRQSEAVSMLHQGDVYLHTKYIDPCPSAVIEAMSCGLPVVYSKTGGTAELVGDEAGQGVSAPLDWTRDIPPDPEELAICVLRVADSLTDYANAARERAVKHFDLIHWRERHAHIFEILAEAE